jgi:hypothetical protein
MHCTQVVLPWLRMVFCQQIFSSSLPDVPGDHQMQLGYIKKRSLKNEYDEASWQDKFIAFKPCETSIGKKKTEDGYKRGKSF